MSFLSGNKAIVEAAVAVGAKFFAGYPITPASTLMEAWVKKAEKDRGLIFLQSEDEIAAIHHIIGAVLAGKPAFTATSGPGFSLMQEGLGLAFVYGAPIVVVNVMRSGPSTGKPTRYGQGEIIASSFGAHGNITPFVFYPTSVEECYRYTVLAFKIAWKHKVPVIILSDAYLASLQEKLRIKSEKLKVELRFRSFRNKHFTGLVDREQNSKKIEEIKKIAERNYCFYHLWGNERSDVLLIGMGSVARALRAFEEKYQIFSPVRIWPFLAEDIVRITKNKKKVVVVEANEGQYVKFVEIALQRKVAFVGLKEETINLGKLKSEILNSLTI